MVIKIPSHPPTPHQNQKVIKWTRSEQNLEEDDSIFTLIIILKRDKH